MKARTLLEGCGVGILLTIGLTWNQLSSYHLDLYHRQLPITTVLRAIAIFVVLACVFGALLVGLLRRVDPSLRAAWWALFAGVLAARVTSGLIAAEVLTRQGVTPLRVFLLFAAAALILWVVRRSWYASAVSGGLGALMLVGFCIFWILPTLVYLGSAKQPQDQLSFARPVAAQSAPHRRVVWLLFDEMSYDQLYDHRRPGLAMPNFDRLRTESINFSNVQPDGYFTEEVLPSLLSGQPVEGIRSSIAGALYVRPTARAAWRPFDADRTLFADAQRMGLTTGLVGSYNPYCRLFPTQLDRCWTALLLFGDHLSGSRSTWGNLIAPLQAAWDRLLHRRYERTPTLADKDAAMMAAAGSLIADEDIDFVFVHLPLPHPPGSYNRKTGKIGPFGSYVDNMALADRMLGELDGCLARTKSAAMTTVVVSSDHSWRVPMWRNAIGWTKEDEEASQGRFETRPILLVRLPGETARTVTQAYPALREHELIEGLLLGGPVNP
jgi:hypothetical protein